MADLEEYPDAKLHKNISFVKSGIRLFGYVLLAFAVPTFPMYLAATVLFVSEVIGIVEEMV